MSKYVSEIIKDIKTNPETWRRYGDKGLQKGDVIIKQFGNGHKFFFGWATSIIDVVINGKNTPTTWIDNYRLEQSFVWWVKNMSLNILSK